MMGTQKTADAYIRDHWIPNKIWKNNQTPKHQERLKKCADLCRGERFADVGCACGHSTETMRGFRPAAWRGIDFSAAAINEAKKLFPNRFWGYIPDLKGLHNLKRFQLDSIVCSEVLEHVVEDRQLVEGLWAAVSERVVYTTPNVKVGDPGHIRVYDESMLAALFAGIPHTVEKAGIFWYIVCDKDQGKFVEDFAKRVEAGTADHILASPEIEHEFSKVVFDAEDGQRPEEVEKANKSEKIKEGEVVYVGPEGKATAIQANDADGDAYLIPPGEEAALVAEPTGLTKESVAAAYDKADEEAEPEDSSVCIDPDSPKYDVWKDPTPHDQMTSEQRKALDDACDGSCPGEGSR